MKSLVDRVEESTSRDGDTSASLAAPMQTKIPPSDRQELTHASEGELSKAMLNAVLDALPVGVIIADAHGKIIRDNAASRDRWGTPPVTTNWEGYSDWVGYWPDSGERLKATDWAMARTLRTGEAVRNELVQSEHFQTGERRFFFNNSAPIYDDQGRIVAGVVVEVDVTECRKVEDQLRESEEKLRQLNADLERQVEERTVQAKDAMAKLFEAQKLESIGQFTSTVVHDFNNVLAVIMGNLRVLQRQLQGQVHEHAIDGAIATAERAASLAGRLLLYARRKESKPQPICLPELLAGMAELFGYSLGPCINCVVNAPAKLPEIMVEPHLMELALVNLATNARDAMPSGGTFTIDVSEERVAQDQDAPALKAGSYVRLSVSDTGCGMNETTLKRAAEPLFTTKSSQNGTGLGLSMISEFVAQSGGAMRLRSVEGKGTSVDLWLPQLPCSGGKAKPQE
jgi:signal transduction histidine kinase